MTNFDDALPPTGASPTPEDRLLGELMGTLADLKSRYDTGGTELAWAAHRAIARHLIQHEGVEAWAQFKARLVQMSKHSIDGIHDILDEDQRRNRMQ